LRFRNNLPTQLQGGGTQPGVVVSPESAKFYNFTSNGRAFTADYIFNYRKIADGLSLQNWNPGNDYPFEYLYLPRAQVEAQRSNWKGGISINALQKAETHALGWQKYYKEKSARNVGIDVAVMGTANGLSKFPYIRDSRRSVGVDGFFIKNEDIWPQPGSKKGRQFDDSIGIGLYVADVHSVLNGTSAPQYMNERVADVAVFTLPFRAHTNQTVSNLLVAGKNMAQTFYVNAATRLQPIEFMSGFGAGVAAQHMMRWALASADVVASIGAKNPDSSYSGAMRDIQSKIVNTQPIWFCSSVGLDKRNCATNADNFRFLLNKPAL
jgi:hypothetical protein